MQIEARTSGRGATPHAKRPVSHAFPHKPTRHPPPPSRTRPLPSQNSHTPVRKPMHTRAYTRAHIRHIHKHWHCSQARMPDAIQNTCTHTLLLIPSLPPSLPPAQPPPHLSARAREAADSPEPAPHSRLCSRCRAARPLVHTHTPFRSEGGTPEGISPARTRVRVLPSPAEGGALGYPARGIGNPHRCTSTRGCVQGQTGEPRPHAPP